MIPLNQNAACRCASYSRLSQEDGDKKESDSIINQKAYIKSYAESNMLQIKKEYWDDGVSGVTFDRPGFQAMLADIQAGFINSIIVKDLSRFGRNYIEAGRYIEQIFPSMGVRFIAINDNYDSLRSLSGSDSMMLPFKNLLNDAYSRDISVKTKTSLEMKRKKGQFISPFAPYGYIKSKQDKNQLEIDEPAAEVVRHIYRMKISGKNSKAIAKQLDMEGVQTPLEYKLANGDRIPCGFKRCSSFHWSAGMVERILQNEIYHGHLIQGKTRRINYKIRKQIPKPKEEWIRCDNTHEPVSSPEILRMVNDLKQIKSRQSSGKDSLSLFSGLIQCGKCKKTLTRKSVGKYHYYGCYHSDKKARCKGIAINEELLTSILLKIIQGHISLLTQMDELLLDIDELCLKEAAVLKLTGKLNGGRQEFEKYERLKASAYADYHEGLLDQEEYASLHEIYQERIKHTKSLLDELQEKRQHIINEHHSIFNWIDSFKQYQNVTALDRPLLLTFFREIHLSPSRQLEVTLHYQDEWEQLLMFTGLEASSND